MKKLGSYIVVTGAYWAFMLTDGALRMLVLLYFHNLGYSPVTLAFLFLFYEVFGVITNLFGGWLAQFKGLKFTLILGLAIQPIALVTLSFMNSNWNPAFAIPFVMIVQAISGISKDLTKMSSKTSIKFLVPKDESSKLFKMVSILTGSKNAIKGFGFFVGGILLQAVGFKYGLWILSALIIIVLILSLFLLPQNIGETKSKICFKKLFDISRPLKLLSGARVFLFASRDIWFVVALPVFFSTYFKWSHSQVGAFMASWVIGYGLVQGLAPTILRYWTKDEAPNSRVAKTISLLLAIVMVLIILLFELNFYIKLTITIGLIIFGFVFALNSSVHSFLVLDYSHGDKAAANVGFYYMANAFGRLIGTLLSGLLFQFGGILWALIGSGTFLVTSYITTRRL
ncbi:organoarsenical effux MFS transporter ArsJ [Thiospirochaeta perfilievii]|uniref:Organoarsenical effux MFS transporter ArsJ n=1 Tax=Thiospirochaeta perfilievii TaxID=252967 RepID=A0A5C1Q5T6_9SPIO|nr:organoarsenical effux MFS transporter ArsJ [Thiospirochaeta perfilievii]QEN03423.1 organoarsenical effux MFS transporter ArsJ [Thiospirochaeta perfilievii]